MAEPFRSKGKRRSSSLRQHTFDNQASSSMHSFADEYGRGNHLSQSLELDARGTSLLPSYSDSNNNASGYNNVHDDKSQSLSALDVLRYTLWVMYVCIYGCMYVRICVCNVIFVCFYVCLYVCICIFICMFVFVYVCLPFRSLITLNVIRYLIYCTVLGLPRLHPGKCCVRHVWDGWLRHHGWL